MHPTERESTILNLLEQQEFVTFSELEKVISASAATLRRDLSRLADEGKIDRVRGGLKRPKASKSPVGSEDNLSGVPFHRNINIMRPEKSAIGRAAANLCSPGTAVMIDGGSTTLQMCRYLDGQRLQVFTNSLHVVNALLPQHDTRVLVPGGSVFREQSIILSAAGDETMPRFHAPLYFLGATAVGPQGVMQPDVVLVASQRRLIDKADEVILLVDHTKFRGYSGNVVCGLEELDVVVTDEGIQDKDVAMLESQGVKVIVASLEGDTRELAN